MLIKLTQLNWFRKSRVELEVYQKIPPNKEERNIS